MFGNKRNTVDSYFLAGRKMTWVFVRNVPLWTNCIQKVLKKSVFIKKRSEPVCLLAILAASISSDSLDQVQLVVLELELLS